MKKEVIIAFDVGTSNVKVSAVDVKNGEMVALERESFPLLMPQLGYREIGAERLWECIQRGFKGVFDKTNETCHYVGIGFSWFGDCVMLADKDGNPVTNILQFSDSRASTDTMEYFKSKNPMEYCQKHNLPPLSMFVAPNSEPMKVLWYKQHEPELFARARYMFDNQQFILAKMGLEPVIDDSLATVKRLAIMKDRKWSKELMDLFEIPYEMNDQRIVSCTDVVGEIDHIGDIKLPNPVPVIPGAHDEVCGMMGLGVLPENKGLVANTMGTSDCMTFFTDYTGKEFPAGGALQVRTKYGQYSTTGHGLAMSGASLNWFIKQFKADEGVDALTGLFNNAKFDGKNPLMMVPYFAKNQVGMKNMSLNTTTEDIFVALAEGLAFELNINMKNNNGLMQKNCGTPITKIIASGGQSQSDAWLQVRANIFGIPVQRSESTEACSVGAAVMAATGLGYYDSFLDASNNMVRLAETFEPDPVVREAYLQKEEKYMEFHNYIVPPRKH